MEYKHMRTPIYGVPIHENLKIWNTNTCYRHMKTPIYAAQTHETPHLCSTDT